MARPAVAALIRGLNPDLSPADVVRLLKQTARQPGSSAHFWNATLGWGILDAGTAVDTARRVDRRPPSSKLRAPKLVRGTRFTLRWSGRDVAAPGLTPSGIRFFDVYASRTGGRPPHVAAVHLHYTIRPTATLVRRTLGMFELINEPLTV